MPTVEDAAALALALPDVVEKPSYGHRAWFVGKAHFAWERPFSKADLRRFGDDPVPAGPILAVRLDDLGEKEALLGSNDAFFTIPHLDGHPIVLIRLEVVSRSDLADAIEDAWLAGATPAQIKCHRES